jgi:hypothetical protein
MSISNLDISLAMEVLNMCEHKYIESISGYIPTSLNRVYFGKVYEIWSNNVSSVNGNQVMILWYADGDRELRIESILQAVYMNKITLLVLMTSSSTTIILCTSKFACLT